MSECLICGNELLTGDIHWQSGMCNKCWDEHYTVKGAVSLDKFYSELYTDLLKDYRKLEQQLAEKDKQLAIREKALKLISQTSQMKEINVTEEELDNTQKHFIEQAKESIK